jgi:hypothetical protein
MKYYLDTEFLEKPNTIELISIGVVAENGDKIYMEVPNAKDICLKDKWLTDNVLPNLKLNTDTIFTPEQIKNKILEFIVPYDPEFYGYYCDYDWVVFCWIFGRMIDLPEGFPMYCRDLKQMLDESGMTVPVSIKEMDNEHDALADAWFNKRLHEWLINQPS